MRCPKCGERVLKKSRVPEEGYVVLGKYVLLRKGSLTAACKKCGTLVELIKSKPTLLRVDKGK